MINANDLHKSFKTRTGVVNAVDGVTFATRDGEITGLLGPNGAGKTTTLRMLYTLMTPDRGSVTVDGMDGSALMDYARVCGTLLAKGHARSTGATVLSGYLGKGDSADRAFARFARAYADQTEADHDALVKAVTSGRLPAEAGI